jgi:hypothetical protein
MNLFDLTQQAKAVLELEEFDEQTVSDTLEGMGLDDKFASYSAVIKTLNADTDAIADAIRHLQDKKKTTENKINRLKEIALFAMQELDMVKAGNAIHSLSVRKGVSLSKLVLDDGSKYPLEFISLVEKHDNAGLKKALKNGIEFKGVHLEDGAPTITIK